MNDTRHHGTPAMTVSITCSKSSGSHPDAMISAMKSDYLRPSGIVTGKLDSSFHGSAAALHECGPAVSPESFGHDFRDSPGKFNAFYIGRVCGMHNHATLSLDGFQDFRMVASNGVHGNSCRHIDKKVPVGVFNRRTATFFHDKRESTGSPG